MCLTVSLRYVLIILGLFSWLVTPPLNRAADAPNIVRVEVAGLQPRVFIPFCQCPRGEVLAGRPGKPASRRVKLPAFAISQTEISVAQFRAVIGGEDPLAPMLKAVAQVPQETGGQEQDLTELLRQGTYPVFCVSINDAVQFCRRLDEVAGSDAVAPFPGITRRQFQLPSHLQWQYACRARSSPDKIGDDVTERDRTHFNAWPSFESLEKDQRVLYQNYWKQLEMPGDFRGTQEQLLALADKEWAADQRVQANTIVLAFLTQAIGSTRRNVQELGRIHMVEPPPAPGATRRVNDWHICDMHDNVTEWVIWADGLATQRAIWNKLIAGGTRALVGEKCYFLAGAGYGESIAEPHDLKDFTIWGGARLNKAKEPSGFAYEDKLVQDHFPGFRVVMSRELTSNWLLVLRRALLSDGRVSADAEDKLRRARETVEEILTPEDHRLALLSLYEHTVLARKGAAAPAHAALSAAMKGKFFAQKEDTDLERQVMGLLKSPAPARPQKP